MIAGMTVGNEQAGWAADGAAGVGFAAAFATQQILDGPRVAIVCDADLYNEAELRTLVREEQQVAQGAQTAALLARLYERHGSDFAEKLRGAFSFVLWDRRERRLVVGIDGFGIKRLAYYQDAGAVLIGSRVDALVRTGDVDPAINPRAIANVLNFTADLAPETIFSRIRRLEPGTVLVISNGQVRPVKYWDMRYGLEQDTDEARLSRELEAVVETSVAAHTKADSFAGLGAFLSGGTDSSTVVGMMTRKAGGPVHAFSIGFQDQGYNELGYAEIAARRFQARHHTYLVGPEDCFRALPDVIRYFDEPYGNSSAVPTYFCARMARENGVRMLLAGDGGDELFGGNERYATDRLFAKYFLVPAVIRKGLIEPALRALPMESGITGRARRYTRRANIPGVERMLSFQFLRTHALERVFDADFLRALGDYSVLDIPNRHYAAVAAGDHLDRLLYVDMKITLADNDLPKVTCMSELAGVQSRFPFLDRAVAEFSGRVPARLKVKGTDKRYLFKKAFRELLPAEIIAKKKHGFGIPVASWLKTFPALREQARDTLFSSRAAGRGYFRREFLEELFSMHQSDDSAYYGDTVWTFFALELWHRQCVDELAKVAA
jgi:asparagine synthase (glutamine-hydrolysing)